MFTQTLLAATMLLLASPAHAATNAQLAAMYHISLAEFELRYRATLAHGIILGFAFAVMYPFGATIIRAFSFKGVLWFHAGWQVVAYLFTLAGLGLGAWLVVVEKNFMSKTAHPILGVIVIGLLLLMPPLGWVHHVLFVKTGKRSSITYIHRWLGRGAIVLGAINGGLGFWMTHSQPVWGIIAYTACAGFFYGQWLTVAWLLEMIKRRKDTVEEKKERVEEGVVEGEEKAARAMVTHQDSESSSQSGSTFVDIERELRVKV